MKPHFNVRKFDGSRLCSAGARSLVKQSSRVILSVGIFSGLLASSCTAPILLPTVAIPSFTAVPMPASSTPLAHDFSPTRPPFLTQESSPVPPTANAPKALNRTHYQLEAVLDYPQHVLSVSETITYTNDIGEALDNLALVVEPARQEAVFHLS